MLCTNVAEILAVTIASIAGLPLPLRPLQILYLNVVTDVFPALALGVGRGRPEVMNNPPRDKDEPVVPRHHWTAIIAWSIVIAICVMAALMIAGYVIGYDVPSAVTVSFLTLALGKLWYVFNLRDHDAPRFDNDIVHTAGSGAQSVCAWFFWPPPFIFRSYPPRYKPCRQAAPVGSRPLR